MKAFVLAAGLGTRLKPFTLTAPKALVPVGGVPMLQRVLLRLKGEGFNEVVINVHHFADMIEDFVAANDQFGMKISISDERETLLDTGGGILRALPLLESKGDDSAFLIHNVDILSDAPLAELMERHRSSGAGASLLVSERESSRQLVFDEEMRLRGWHNLSTGEYRPSNFISRDGYAELAFSGIHIMTPSAVREEMTRQGRGGAFSVVDFYLESQGLDVRGVLGSKLNLIDIGKPETLNRANELL